METVANRLKKIRIEWGHKTSSEAARRHNWNEHTYRAQENGSRGISAKWLATFAKAYRVPLSVLATGQEDAHLSSATQAVPVLTYAMLGSTSMTAISAAQKAASDAKETVSFGRDVGILPIALPVEDDSMHFDDHPQCLRVGDTVAIDVKRRVKPGCVACIYDKDERMHCFRRATFLDKKTVKFEALNPAYPPTILPASSEHIIGVAVAFNRML